MRGFVNTGSTLPLGKGNWINQDILYAPKLEGGFYFIDARTFFENLLDQKIWHWQTWWSLGWNHRPRAPDLKRKENSDAHVRPEALTCMINKKFPCIEGFFKAWIDFKTSYHFRPAKTHNNILHSPIFFNPWILRNPTIKEYGKVNPEEEYLKPEQFGLSNDDCWHKKIIDMLDENRIKPISVLKDDHGFAKLNLFSLFRLKTPLEKFGSRNNLSLRSTGVTILSVQTGETPLDHASLKSTGITLPSEKTGRTPLDYVPCISEAFKRIIKGSSYYRRTLSTTDERYQVQIQDGEKAGNHSKEELCHPNNDHA